MKWFKIFSVVVYLVMLFGLTGFGIWSVSDMTGDSFSNASQAFGGYPDVIFDVHASTPVCVKAVSDRGTFDVATSSGHLKPTDNIAGVYFANGCFAPGVWKVVDGQVTIQPLGPSDLSVTTIHPLRVKIVIGGLFYLLVAIAWIITIKGIWMS